jgi:DNA-binding transcriptional MerR regulator
MPDHDLISIGRFARLTGLSVGALRHYDEHGILAPAAVNPETSYRMYRREQVEEALLVGLLRSLEMPLDDVRAYLLADPAERRRRLDRHRARIQARADRLHRILHQLNQETPMTSPATPTAATSDVLDAEAHRRLAAELFNHVWRLLEAEERSAEDDDEMIHAAHASRWHWSRTGASDLNQRLAVGEWQCSRVYAVLGRGEPALFHARRCLERAEGGGDAVEGWVVASAYEAMARASSVHGDRAAFEEWRARARSAAAAIEDEEEREVIEGDLATLA